jgi:hypothetical protein
MKPRHLYSDKAADALNQFETDYIFQKLLMSHQNPMTNKLTIQGKKVDVNCQVGAQFQNLAHLTPWI